MRPAAALCGLALLGGCSMLAPAVRPPAQQFVDLRFTAGSSQRGYAYAVDRAGALWYLDGRNAVRQTSPVRREAIGVSGAQSGTIFSYDGAIYVLAGDGATLTRLDGLHVRTAYIPSPYVPAEGAVADARHRWIVFAQAQPGRLAVVDVWRWYAHRLPSGIAPFASALAGGPHAKKYLIVGDERRPLVAIENRWTNRALLMSVADNTCFSSDGSPWQVPVDVRGRDSESAWVSSGTHVASIDLSTKRSLRVWNLEGCAMRLLGADADRALVLVAALQGGDFTSFVVRVDRNGARRLASYGEIAGIPAGAILDGYDRLWWYDPKAHSFYCRTPLGAE